MPCGKPREVRTIGDLLQPRGFGHRVLGVRAGLEMHRFDERLVLRVLEQIRDQIVFADLRVITHRVIDGIDQPGMAHPIEREVPQVVVGIDDLHRNAYITAPICQGTNSSSPKPSASLLVWAPEAVLRIVSKMRWPISATVASPSMTMPQLMSMSSVIAE